MVRPLVVCALALVLPVLARAETRRIGTDGFRVGQEFRNAVLSPDGRVFAVSTASGFHLLDAVTGQVLRTWTSAAEVKDLTFDAPGRLLVLDRAGWVRAFDPRTGEQQRAVLIAADAAGNSHSNSLRDLCDLRFLAGGRFVSIASGLIDSTTCQPLTVKSNGERVTAAADGSRLALVHIHRPLLPHAGGELVPGAPQPAVDDPDSTIRLLDLKTGAIRVLAVAGNDRIEDLSFLPGGRDLYALVGEQPTLFDLETGLSRPLHLEHRDIGYESPVWSPDGERMALTHFDRDAGLFVREWDLRTGAMLREWQTSDRHTLAYTPDGRLLIWHQSGTRLDVQEIGQATLPREGHRDQLVDVVFGPGDTLVTLDVGRIVCRWNLRTGAMLDRRTLPGVIRTKTKTIPAAANWLLDPHGTAALLRAGQGIARFDLDRGRLDRFRATPLAPDANSPDGRWLLEWKNNWGHLFDRAQAHRVLLPPDNELWPSGRDGATLPFWSPDGRWLALGRFNHWQDDGEQHMRLEIPIVKLPTGRLFARIEVEGFDATALPLFTPDGALFLVEHDGRVDAFDPASGELRRQYRPATEDGALLPLAVSPDSRLLLAVNRTSRPEDACLQLIELATGGVRRRLPIPPGWHDRVPARFSPDGRWIAFALTDATVLLQSTDDETAPRLDPATLWRDLASPDAAVAGVAVQTLAGRPDAVRWLRARLTQPTRVVEPELPAAFWLAELDHDDPARREAARRKLVEQPEMIDEVEAALTGQSSLEVRHALLELRAEQAALKPPTTEELRRLRIAEALERLDTGAARDLLARWRRAD